MARKLISYDDEAEGTGLPDVVETRLQDHLVGETTATISGNSPVHAGKLVRLNEDGKLHIGVGTVVSNNDPANKQYVDSETSKRAPRTHGHRGSEITSETTHFVNFTDDRFANQLLRLNSLGTFHITTAGITSPTNPVNKQYVDASIQSAIENLPPGDGGSGPTGSGQTMWWN